jgi:exopolysaccharide biosynthesis polyprenyl glycosylphosphotransferase
MMSLSNSSLSSAKRKSHRIQLQLSERRLLMMFGDALMILVAVLIALAVWAYVGKIAFTLNFILPNSIWFFILMGLWFLLANANGYYEFAVAADRATSLQRLSLITLQMIVIYMLVFFFSARDALPRLFILYFGVAAFLLLLLWRLLNPALIGWASTPRRVLVVGTDWAAETIIETLKTHATNAYYVLGAIGTAGDIDSLANSPVLGPGADIVEIIEREGVTEIIVTSMELQGEIFQGVMDAYENGVVITPMPLLYERIMERVPVEHVGDNWAVVLPLSGKSAFKPYPLLKRLMDMLIAFVGLALFAIVLPFIAFFLYLDSRGSIFYAQERVGLNGRNFRIYKLRSMKPDAEAQTGAVFAQVDDNRITRVGRFLRKTRLDEVPQLWNILKGEMSMIGPRPERPEHVSRLQEKIPFYRTRHIIPPGLTGWAQVRYHYGANDEDALIKLQYDLYYIRHQSLMLDFGILLRTVGKVLRMSGQ